MRPAVVIPTVSEERPRTLESVPNEVQTYVVRKGNRSEARNIGAERSIASPLVFCDDDITFDHHTFWELILQYDRDTVVGLRDFDFGLALTRFMVVDRRLFNDIGGFDESLNHMEDTEFCLRALQQGVAIETVPRSVVDHADHDDRVDAWQRLRSMVTVVGKHPLLGPKYLSRML